MCLYSTIGKNKKYVANKKNGGIIPAVNDERCLWVAWGCGKCIECRKQKANEWRVRLAEEIKENKNGKFVTLTFSNESIKELAEDIKELEGYELDNEIATLGMRRFLERWRKEFGKSVRHWMITELGHNGTENIHIHGIIWTDESRETLARIWKYGWIFPRCNIDWNMNYVNARTVNYIVKYVNKIDGNNKYYESKILASNKPGIGLRYIKANEHKINKYKEGKTEERYRTSSGHKIGMPTYYKNKIYTDEEKEKLWIEKLNKEERYILGNKIKISDGEEAYYKALEYAREKNKKLGYGNDEINWDKKQYDIQRRNLKIKERIDKAEKNSKQ